MYNILLFSGAMRLKYAKFNANREIQEARSSIFHFPLEFETVRVEWINSVLCYWSKKLRYFLFFLVVTKLGIIVLQPNVVLLRYDDSKGIYLQ